MNERAHRVIGEYRRHAEKLDNTPGVTPGVKTRLESFTPVRGVVAGQFGECSDDVHSLIDVCADAIAAKEWRALGARSAKEARGFIVAKLRRRIGLVVVREMARHRLKRVPLIGVPREALSPLARFLRAGARPGNADEPLDRPPAFVPEDFFAFQAHTAAPPAAH